MSSQSASPSFVRTLARGRRPAIDDGNDEHRTESQADWANWAAHGYRKLYQPRSVRRFGLAFTVVLSLVLLAVFWLAAHGTLP
jgi:hypothetical protein